MICGLIIDFGASDGHFVMNFPLGSEISPFQGCFEGVLPLSWGPMIAHFAPLQYTPTPLSCVYPYSVQK